MRSNLLALRVIAAFLGKNKTGTPEMQANEMENLNKDFMLDFDDPKLKNFEKTRKRVELIARLRHKARKV